MSGIFLFNPVFARKNVPGNIRTGLAFLCALAASGTLDAAPLQVSALPVFMLLCVKELMIGFIVGFVVNLFLSSVLVAGELIDFQSGLSMAKVYDPQSNSSIPLAGSLVNILFMLSFFMSNGHLTIVKIAVYSLRALPPGPELFGFYFAQYLVLLFAEILVMAVKIAFPFIAVETMTEFGIGILMKTVPQIHVFSINIQLRLIIGLALLLLMVPSMAYMMDSMVGCMFERIGYTITLIG